MVVLSLRGLLHSACHLITGYPNNPDKKNEFVGYPKTKHDQFDHGLFDIEIKKEKYPSGFQMPLHYPRYKKTDYDKMEEWRLDLLLKEYGFCFNGSLEDKREFAMGAFLWPDQY